MMKNIVKKFVKYGILSNSIIAVTLILGIVSILSTNKSFFPERDSNILTVQVAYPGASPEEMEEGITQRIEEAVRSLVGIEEINSTSSENFASITIEGVEGYDLDELYQEVKNSVDGISSFPVGAERPVIFKQKNKTPVMWVGLRANNESITLNDLKKGIEEVEEDFLASSAVSQVRVMGYPDREISVEVTEENLSRYGLTFSQVANLIRRNNRDISGGSIKATDEEILIRARHKKTEAQKIADMVVASSSTGAAVRLGDIAKVKEQFADVPNFTTLNGDPAVYMLVEKLNDEDLEAITDYVDEYVAGFNEKHPQFTLEPTFKFMDMLQQRLDMLLSNGGIGLLLVLIALGTFLSLRLSLWVAWGIPSSFLGLFIIGSFVGLTINMISLFGMILVVGILVDDGIVIAENIYVHFERGKSAYKAAVDGTVEVMPAVFTSVMTTIVAFSPLLVLEGQMSFMRDMAIVVIGSLAFSLIEAFLVLPAHLASPKVLQQRDPNSKGGRIRGRVNNFLDYFRFKVYGNALRFTMNHKRFSVAFLLALFPLTFGLIGGGFIKSTFFPRIPFNSVNVEIAFKAGTREALTEEYIKDFEDKVWEVNEEIKRDFNDTTSWINYTFANVGSSKYGSGGHTGNVNVFFKELDDAPISDVDLINRLRKKIGQVPEADKFSIGNVGRWGKPVSIMLMGKNGEDLDNATAMLEEKLTEIPDLKEINDDKSVGKRELQVDLLPQARFLGLTENDIVSQIRQGFFGEEAQRLQIGRDEVRVWVRYPNSGRTSIGQLEEMKVKFNGNEYFLKDLASFSIERGIASIKHYNANRTITVEADLIDPYAELPPILEKIDTDIIPLILAKYPSVRYESGGQAKESQKSGQQIMKYFGGALFIMFMLIVLQFKSFYQGVLVVSMIPLGWIGASWGHGVHGLPVSILSAWGMVALSGVIINDAVVFLDKYNRNIKSGMKVYDAAFDAGISRFRPIMLTSITTVAGLYPLILETSFQAQFLIPMAISVAWGVLIGTMIILMFFPVLIVAFNEVRRYAKWIWEGGELPNSEDVERVIIDAKKDAIFDDDHEPAEGYKEIPEGFQNQLNGYKSDYEQSKYEEEHS